MSAGTCAEEFDIVSNNLGHTQKKDFSVLDRTYSFRANFVQKIQLFSLSWDLVVTISHINYWDQANSWKNFWKFWNGSLCRNKPGPYPATQFCSNWKSSNTNARGKKLSQILANNIDKGGSWDWSHNLCEALSKKINKK